MSNPYNWHFPQRNETMFLGTIESTQNNSQIRQPSFQRNDIPGAQTKQQIPAQVNRDNFAHSAFIEPIPNSHVMRNKFIGGNSLRTNDIEGAQPQCNQFKSSRITNPINPRYKLPYLSPIQAEPPAKFIRDPLNISDIKTKITSRLPARYDPQPIEGSSPSKLFRTLDAVNRLDVKDINRDGIFVTRRMNNPVNPLEPTYTWRDNRESINQQYGEIGNHSRRLYDESNRKLDRSLNVKDIEGTQTNSYYQRRLFLSKRKEEKNGLNSTDIPKSTASSLLKGISTSRHVNPLMPQYNYL